MTRCLIIGMGGTIAMTPGGAPGVVPKLTAEMLVSAVPELRAIPGLEAASFRLKPSAHISFDDLEALAAHIIAEAQTGLTGVVIAQGTDTIEETTFALDLLLNLNVPVVVTGAMRNPSLPGADGPANLLAAVQVASSEAARDLGVLVVMNDRIHAARFVQKRHTTDCAAFVSPNAGPIGEVSEGVVRIRLRLARTRPISGAAVLPAKVALLSMALDDQGELIRAASEAGFDGMVIAGMGGGHATEAASSILAEVAARMPVVLASRAGAGQMLTQTYGFAGGEIDLLSKGLIPAGMLDPVKARVLLTLLLRRQTGSDGIFEAFSRY